MNAKEIVRYIVLGICLALGAAFAWFIIWPWVRSW